MSFQLWIKILIKRCRDTKDNNLEILLKQVHSIATFIPKFPTQHSLFINLKIKCIISNLLKTYKIKIWNAITLKLNRFSIILCTFKFLRVGVEEKEGV